MGLVEGKAELEEKSNVINDDNFEKETCVTHEKLEEEKEVAVVESRHIQKVNHIRKPLTAAETVRRMEEKKKADQQKLVEAHRKRMAENDNRDRRKEAQYKVQPAKKEDVDKEFLETGKIEEPKEHVLEMEEKEVNVTAIETDEDLLSIKTDNGQLILDSEGVAALEALVETSKELNKAKEIHANHQKAVNDFREYIGEGILFQFQGTVYRLVEPTGHFVAYRRVVLEHTRREGDKAGTVSLKAAKEAGFEVE